MHWLNVGFGLPIVVLLNLKILSMKGKQSFPGQACWMLHCSKKSTLIGVSVLRLLVLQRNMDNLQIVYQKLRRLPKF